jgi:hypothetical protein
MPSAVKPHSNFLVPGRFIQEKTFTWAAFLFQHGSGPNDFLLAHTLAMIAMKKG